MNQNNKFISLLLVLVSFVIMIFFTKWFFYDLQWNLDIHSKNEEKLEEKKEELSKLKALKDSLAKWKDGEIEKYSANFREDILSAYIYWYVEDTNGQGWFIAIKDIHFVEGKNNEYWFKEWKLELSIRVSDELTLLRFLSFLISKDSEHKFFIESLSYSEIESSMGGFNISIPLKVFYK
jgi:hypothetical protein